MCPSLAEPDSGGFSKSHVSHETIRNPLQLFHRNSCKIPVFCSGFTRRGGLVRPASKSCRFSHHPLRVPKAWHGDFAACEQRSGLLAHTSPAFLKNCWIKKLLFACGLGLETILLKKTVFPVRQKGVPPLLLPASVLQLPRCLARTYNLDFHDSTLFELNSFKKCNCSRENRLQNLVCFANVGYSPTPRQHF